MILIGTIISFFALLEDFVTKDGSRFNFDQPSDSFLHRSARLDRLAMVGVTFG